MIDDHGSASAVEPLAELAQAYAAARAQAARVIVGQEATFELLFVALLAGGHILLEGVPGTAKTLLAQTLAALVAGTFRRVQFTPDLMPSDVVGTTVFDPRAVEFHFGRGRSSAMCCWRTRSTARQPRPRRRSWKRWRSAVRRSTGEGHPLPDPFLVVATQNPVEYEGTYPLPEAQLDRFMFKLTVDYGSAEVEREVVRRHLAGFERNRLESTGLQPVLSPADLLALPGHPEPRRRRAGRGGLSRRDRAGYAPEPGSAAWEQRARALGAGAGRAGAGSLARPA